jgi:hypothetical protein
MEIFNNQQRSGYREIVSYGPRWWTEYKEMDANYQYAGWTLDLMAYWLERIINNQFPAYADERAIATFEKVLDLEPDENDSLEERRRIVAAYYSGTGKLSRSVIQSIVRSYTGCESELWWLNQTLQIRVSCNEEVSFSNNKIYRILNRRMPAHIPFKIRNMLCIFLTEETFNQTIKHRISMVWWKNRLDGAINLDGSFLLESEYPTQWKQRHIALFSTVENFINKVIYLTTEIQNVELVKITSSHRVLLNWWEDLRTLDGYEKMDGTKELNQDVPPKWNIITFRTEIKNEEKIGISMYIPSKAATFNSSFLCDGTIKLNSGREEL